MADTYDFLFKFLIIGNSGTGKTCLLRRFSDGTFREESIHTVGVEFGSKIIQIGGKAVKLQIWDTAGQERFQCVTRSYYRGAACAMIVYDVTSRESFNRVSQWLSSARELARPELAVLLVGNKTDLPSDLHEVTPLEAQQFAEENGIYAFMETSAKSGVNVQEAFFTIARHVLERAQQSDSGELFSPGGIGPAKLIAPASRTVSTAACCW